MNRLAEEMVFSGLSTAWRFANWPTKRSPVLVKPTTDGVKRFPSLLMTTVGLPPSMTATTEFVVPRSIPIAFPMTGISVSNWETTRKQGLLRGINLICNRSAQAPSTYR